MKNPNYRIKSRLSIFAKRFIQRFTTKPTFFRYNSHSFCFCNMANRLNQQPNVIIFKNSRQIR